MATFAITNFGAGVDARSPVFAASPGTLSIGRDVHITSGGHLEKRKAFVEHSTLPPGTFGLAGVREQVFVFGSIAPPAGLPTSVFYQRLVHPTGAAMTKLIDVELFDGKFYTLAAYTTDTVHFYDGTRVADWLVASDPPDAAAFTGGTSLTTLGQKVYVTNGPNLHFCATADPTKFKIVETGAGFINMSTHSSGSQDLIGTEIYYNSLAVFSSTEAQLWHVESDDTQNVQVQTLKGNGSVGPRAATSFSDGDTFVLTSRGVRTIQPRDNSSGRSKLELASAPVDKELVEYMKTLSPEVLASATLLVEPDEGRLWAIIGGRIYVLSWFPDRKIRAWTEYRPGFTVDWAAVVDNRMWLRSGDTLYVYGGMDNDQYFEGQALIRLPYLDMRAPATYKGLHGFDLGCVGTWEVWIGQRPDDPATYERAAIVTGETFDGPAHKITGITTHISVELRHTGAEQAQITALLLHFKSNETD